MGRRRDAMVLAALLATPLTAQAAEREVTIAGAAGPLRGAYLFPEQAPAPPVVVIIPGSGPTNRDGDGFFGIRTGAYRLLAEGLVERGVASVRIDKRGMFRSAARGVDPNAATLAAYAEDARAWLRAMKAEAGVRCVWLAGHSEGGLVALAAAQQPDDLCGLVLLAAPGRPLMNVLREQFRADPASASVLDQAMAVISEIEAGRRVDVTDLPDRLRVVFNPRVQDFLIDLAAYDPAALARAYKGPMLILQGDTDIQVSTIDAERLARAHRGAKLVLLPGINHVFKAALPDRAANAATYRDPSLPISAEAVDAIADFVKARR